jgi:hypothetical protein
MQKYVFYTSLHAPQLREAVARLPGLFAGEGGDDRGISRGFKLRLAFMWLSLVKEAFIVKARGGTDACGISWPGLSPAYLAYGRGPKSTRTAGKHAPGGNDGFMSAKQLKTWQANYARNLRWLAAREKMPEAKSHAAAIAWSLAKKAGVRTKLAVFGSRIVDILRDRGILFNSLQPGIFAANGADATYQVPEGQIVEDRPGVLAVGTNVAYAVYHQGGTRKDRSEKGRGAIRRQIWPEAHQIPQEWWDDLLESALQGAGAIGRLIAEGKL